MKWGGLMAIALIIMGLVFYLTGVTDMETGESGIANTILSYVISVGAIVMGISAFKKDNANYLSIGEGIKQGLLISLIAGLILAVWTFVFFSFIEPDLLNNMQENALSQSGEVSEEQEEMMGGIFGAIFNPGTMGVMVLVMKLFLGLIVGLIAGAIMKTDKPVEFVNDASDHLTS